MRGQVRKQSCGAERGRRGSAGRGERGGKEIACLLVGQKIAAGGSWQCPRRIPHRTATLFARLGWPFVSEPRRLFGKSAWLLRGHIHLRLLLLAPSRSKQWGTSSQTLEAPIPGDLGLSIQNSSRGLTREDPRCCCRLFRINLPKYPSSVTSPRTMRVPGGVTVPR